MSNDQITKEWVITIEGVVCTIYDWRRGRTPLRGLPYGMWVEPANFLIGLFRAQLYKWRGQHLGIDGRLLSVTIHQLRGQGSEWELVASLTSRTPLRRIHS